MCVRWTYSSRTAVGIVPRRVASGCCDETTVGILTVSSRSRVSCGGASDHDPTTPTEQCLLSTGSTTALDSTSNLSRVAGNSFWKAVTTRVNVTSGNMTSTATLSSGSRPPAKLFARAFTRVGEQRSTLIRQHRKAGAAIEQLHPELSLQIRQGLADHGLRATQAAARCRETSFIRSNDENAELIERNTIQHTSAPAIHRIE